MRVEDPFALHQGAAETWRFIDANVLKSGVVDQAIKDVCFRYISDRDAIDIRSLDERERAALEWTNAIVWDAESADDNLWERLHSMFSEPELVDLGCSIGFELGRQHFLRTLGLTPHP